MKAGINIAPKDFTITIRQDSLTISGLAKNNNASIPIIALHGWLDNAASFLPLMSQLNDFSIYALDFIGHGKSSHLPKGMRYDILDYVFHVVEVIDKLQFSKVHLLGHSLGACIASLIAGAFPEKLASPVLIEGIGPLTHKPSFARESIINHWREWQKGENKSLPRYKDLEEAASTRSTATKLDIDAAKTLAIRGTEKINDGVTWATDKRLKLDSALRMTEKQVHSFIKEIISPTFLAWGKESKFKDSKQILKRKKLLHHYEEKLYPGGHHFHMTNFQELADDLNNFWKKNN